ncbi:hypothetical protein Dvar_62360 [Desulfosarcina variabilis str. Montpellier]|uniref:LbtU family siderophore porin n=1 Tax=Desulfosarcina variabilis TaxID=2300 RepID=UPI003AFA0382
MKKMTWVLLFLLLYAVVNIPLAIAEVMSNHELSQRVKQLEEKLQTEEEGALAEWAQRITIGGVVEAEVGYTTSDPVGGESTDGSDIAVATVEVGIGAKIVDHVSGDILFLYEDGDDGVNIDEAFITIDGEDAVPLYLRVGQLYVPFGNFESNMISDPLTLEIAETGEGALQVGTEIAGLYASAFIFNGDMNEIDDSDDHIDNFGANAGFGMESDAFSVDVGVSYINNLTEADNWEDTLEEITAGVEDELVGDDEEFVVGLKDYVGGLGAYAIIGVGPITFIGEYITALDDVEWVYQNETTGDVTNYNNDKIAAWNLEIGFGFAIGGKETTLAVAYQATDNAQNILPETRYLGSIGVGIFENTTLALEYLMDEYENDNEETALTAQLAIEF